MEAHLGFWLRFVSNHVSNRFRLTLEARGVSVTEWVALRTLWARSETSHAELIKKALGMTKGAASKVFSRLEEKGIAARQFAGGSSQGQSMERNTGCRCWVESALDWLRRRTLPCSEYKSKLTDLSELE